jgi:hypothetical protein
MLVELPYQLVADGVLALHFAVAVFVVGGLVLIIAGNVRGWQWVNAPWFRVAHLGSIGAVVAEAWLGVTCPLTTLENWLRAKAGATTYSVSFIEHWLQRLLFYEAPSWVFVLGYSVFGMLVLAAWWYFPPRSKSHRNETGA